MVDTPEKTSGFAAGNPQSVSDYVIGLQGGANVKFKARGRVSTQTTPYAGTLSDCDGWVRLGDGGSNNTQVAFMIPKNADQAIPILGTITVECLSTGGMAIVGDVGVTVNPVATNGLAVFYKGGVAVCTKVGTNEWVVCGAQTV